MKAILLLNVQDGFRTRYFGKDVDLPSIPCIGEIFTIVHPDKSGGEKCTYSYGAKAKTVIFETENDPAVYSKILIQLEPLPTGVNIKIIEQDASWKEVTTGSQTEE